MKKQILSIKIVILLGILFCASRVNAQDAIGNLFKSSPEDAGKLINAYLNPLFKGLNSGLNSGWYNTAKTNGLLRFNVRFSSSLMFVPSKDRAYNLSDLGLTGIKPQGVGQTIFGNNTSGDEIQIINPSNPNAPISGGNLPRGVGVHFMPVPQLQFTAGLPKHIDVAVRFVPNLNLGSNGGKIGLWGVGTKIEPIPLILGSKAKALPFDVAIGAHYTQLNYNIVPSFSGSANTNQEVDLKVNGFVVDAILSKKILFFTPFIAVGYNDASSNITASGLYNFDTALGSTMIDGSKINFAKTTTKSAQGTVGFELSFVFVKFYASYTLAQYNYFNGGIGIGIGK